MSQIERNDRKQLCVETSPVDWSVYTWTQWVRETTPQNRKGFSYIFSWSCRVWLLAPPFFVTFQLLCLAQEIKKKTNFQLAFEPVIFSNFFAFGYCLMIVLWLEIHDVFFRYFLSFKSVTSGVTAYNVDVFKKKTRDNTGISFPHHRNQFQTSIKLSLRFKSWVHVVIGNIK